MAKSVFSFFTYNAVLTGAGTGRQETVHRYHRVRLKIWLGRRTGLLLPGSRYYHAHLKHHGAILHELLPLCRDVALQCAATFVIHLRHGTR